jgi:hypothetical protein
MPTAPPARQKKVARRAAKVLKGAPRKEGDPRRIISSSESDVLACSDGPNITDKIKERARGKALVIPIAAGRAVNGASSVAPFRKCRLRVGTDLSSQGIDSESAIGSNRAI